MLLTTHHHCDCALSPHNKWQLCPHWESTQTFLFPEPQVPWMSWCLEFHPFFIFLPHLHFSECPLEVVSASGVSLPSPVTGGLSPSPRLPPAFTEVEKAIFFPWLLIFTWWPKLSKPAFKGLGLLPQDRVRCFVRSMTGYLNQPSAKAHLLPSR